jgi:hypothetical protein
MIEGLSWAERLGAMSPEERAATIAAMTDEQTEELRLEWIFWRRPEQTPPPGDWRVWLSPRKSWADGGPVADQAMIVAFAVAGRCVGANSPRDRARGE